MGSKRLTPTTVGKMISKCLLYVSYLLTVEFSFIDISRRLHNIFSLVKRNNIIKLLLHVLKLLGSTRLASPHFFP